MWTIATSEKYIHHVCLCTSLLLQFLWKHAKCSDISIVMTKYIILLLGIWSSIDCSTCWWTASYVLRLRQIPSVGSFAGWVGKSQVHKYQYLAHLWVHLYTILISLIIHLSPSPHQILHYLLFLNSFGNRNWKQCFLICKLLEGIQGVLLTTDYFQIPHKTLCLAKVP